jgi:signal peptidase II
MPIWTACLAAGAVVALDRASKAAALRWLTVRGKGILRLVRNDRPFICPGETGRLLVGAWILAASCGAGALQAMPSSDSRGLTGVALAIALGSAASNIADRLAWGIVADFIRIGRWPVFNLADVAIVVGGALALGSLL